MRQFCFTLLLLLCSGFLFSQSKVSDDYIAWSATRKLTANDFIISGTNFIKELNAKIISDMAKRRIDYDTETKFGNDAAKQAEWENEIWIELKGLKEFGRE